MSNKKNMIKVSEIDRLIAEEITRLKKVEQIKSRLAVVNEELKRLGEEEGIEEVSVGGTRNGEEWYQKGVPVPKFEKKGTHLKEEDPTFGDESTAGSEDVMGDDTLEIGDETGSEEVLETFEEKLAAIGRELDMKFGGGAGMGAEIGDEEIGVDLDDAGEEPAPEPETMESPEADAAPEAEEAGEDEIEIDEVEVPEAFAKEEKPAMNESRDNLGKKNNPILARELKRATYLAGLSDEE